MPEITITVTVPMERAREAMDLVQALQGLETVNAPTRLAVADIGRCSYWRKAEVDRGPARPARPAVQCLREAGHDSDGPHTAGYRHRFTPRVDRALAMTNPRASHSNPDPATVWEKEAADARRR